MNKINLKELRQKAEAATPGPWDYYLEQGYEGNGVIITYSEDESGMRSIKGSVFKRLVADEKDKMFLAAANPATVLTLIDALEKTVKMMVFYGERTNGLFAREALKELSEMIK
jgi:hypothetical protein